MVRFIVCTELHMFDEITARGGAPNMLIGKCPNIDQNLAYLTNLKQLSEL